MSFTPSIYVIDDANQMAQTAADHIVALVTEVRQKHNRRLTLALAGGSTPKSVYQLLNAQHPKLIRDDIEFFFGDVRMVPDDDKESNFAMVRDSLFKTNQEETSSSFHVHAIDTSAEPAKAAAEYEATIRKYFAATEGLAEGQVPSFDLIMLGFGPDGHTASLFPHTQAPLERSKLVTDCMPTPNIKPLVHRVTMTYPLIVSARHVMVLARGAEKKWVLEGVVHQIPSKEAAGEDGKEALPVSALLRDSKHSVHLYVDAAAAPSKL
eukprot:GILI01008595.1.p1 GENE.GILI01008595.1~~GILI01008595.1.p1  ORF type:complete len:266 (-),score=70.56 GILI01008595.1:45-842(-)